MSCESRYRVVRAASMPGGSLAVPVAIVGAGACGLTAAIGLRDAGLDCLLLERDAVPGGSTALSSGFVPAAGTRLQRSLGIADSARLFVQDVMAKSHGQAARSLLEAYVGAVAQAIDALQAQGLAFEILDGFLYPGHSARRMHALPQRSGTALMAGLERTATALGADILTGALVRELWMDAQDRVIGLACERPGGALEYLGCDALLLACNGFAGQQQMVREMLPAMQGAAFGGHAGNDGAAIAWGRAVGARLADLGGCQGHGSWVTPHGALMTWAVMMQGGIQINGEGRRFHDESLGYSEAAVQVLAQPGGVAWNVFDDSLLELARGFPDFVAAQEAGAVRDADDVQALARWVGCDARTLQATLEALVPGQVDAFGRHCVRGLQPPWHAVKVTGALFHTQGGLDVDAGARVLRSDGRAFPNLWAAGGAARGVSGNQVSGYLSGNGLLSAIGGGWLAASTMAGQLHGQPA